MLYKRLRKKMNKKTKSRPRLLIGCYLFIPAILSLVSAYFLKHNVFLLTFCLSIALIFFKTGWGIIQAKSWARVSAIILLIFLFIKSLIYIPRVFEDLTRMGLHISLIEQICFLSLFFFLIALNLFMIYYLTRENVKKVFSTKNMAAEENI